MKHFILIFFTFMPCLSYGQTITGVVRDQHADILPGITVVVKGTTITSITNATGNFTIKVPSPNSILRFTGVGFEPQEIYPEGKNFIEVRMAVQTGKLDEVQVIAYGTTTQRYNLGSVSKVTAEDIDRQAVTNPLSALQGQVPGLVVTSTSGLPGATVNLQIRGQNTLNPVVSAGPAPINNPLFIVDGVPFTTQNTNINQFSSVNSPGVASSLNNPYGGISPFNTIDPQDIESIEVLRDADATAIYGSRGGNGVILITTKKGKAGKTEFNLNMNSGISVIGHTMPMMNTSQYLEMRREAFANDKIVPNLTPFDPGYAPDLLAFDSNTYTDWKKFFLGNTAHNTEVNTSVSGGTAATQFHVGANYHRDTYIFPGDYADDRINFLVSLHHQSTDKKFVLDFSSVYSYEKNNSSGSPNLLTAYTLEPNFPALQDANGNLNWFYKGVNFDGAYAAYNPLAYLKTLYSIQSNVLNGNLVLNYELIKGLTMRTSLGYNTLNSTEYYGNPKSAQNPANTPIASARFGNNNFSTWIAEPQIEYKNTTRNSVYSVLIGGTFQTNNNIKQELDGSGYINDNLIGSVSGAPTKSSSDSYNEYKYTAVFGRISYRYDDKYLINITARRDGSSRFGPGKQFGNFGSVGAGWIFTEEPIVKDFMPFLSFGKIRGSYGITGSDAIADYQYISRWAPTVNNYQGNLGYLPQNLFNPDFSWASTKKLEAGLEFGLFKDKVLVNATWYRNRSGDQLITYQLPSQTGFSTVVENWDAVVQNSGFEFIVQATVVKTGSLTWKSSLNITVPKNVLLSFPDINKSSYATTYIVGQSVNLLNEFRYAGVNAATGMYQFYNAGGQLTNSPLGPASGNFRDYQNIGNTDPKFYGGLQNSFTFKRIQLDVFFEFRKQMGANYLAQTTTYVPGWEYNQPQEFLSRWQSAGDLTNVQMFTSQLGTAGNIARTYFLHSSAVYSDASYLRLKTASLSYSFPAGVTKKLGVSRLQIFLTGQNLLTVTNYLGNDPETQNFYGVPPLKTVVAGLHITL